MFAVGTFSDILPQSRHVCCWGEERTLTERNTTSENGPTSDTVFIVCRFTQGNVVHYRLRWANSPRGRHSSVAILSSYSVVRCLDFRSPPARNKASPRGG